MLASPFPLRLRFERAAARRYFRFSWPIFVPSAAMLVLLQGQLLAFDVWGGIAAVGHITLAYTLTRYADRADHVVASTIYPAICAVADRRDTLEEIFVKSNRAAMIWMVPFCAAIVLFAPDLVEFVLGEDDWSRRWSYSRGSRPPPPCSSWASTGSRSSGRAASRAAGGRVGGDGLRVPRVQPCRPPALWGATGFVVGRAPVSLAMRVRARYLHRLLPLRAALGARAARERAGGGRCRRCAELRGLLRGGGRPLWQALAELLVFLALTALATRAFERDLLREFAGYLRTGKLTPAAA